MSIPPNAIFLCSLKRGNHICQKDCIGSECLITPSIATIYTTQSNGKARRKKIQHVSEQGRHCRGSPIFFFACLWSVCCGYSQRERPFHFNGPEIA